MGGEGVAEPAFTCSLMYPSIFFAMVSSLADQRPARTVVRGGALPRSLRNAGGTPAFRSGRLLDLRIFEFHRGGPTEDGNSDPQAGAVLVDLLHRAIETGEGAVDDPD